MKLGLFFYQLSHYICLFSFIILLFTNLNNLVSFPLYCSLLIPFNTFLYKHTKNPSLCKNKITATFLRLLTYINIPRMTNGDRQTHPRARRTKPTVQQIFRQVCYWQVFLAHLCNEFMHNRVILFHWTYFIIALVTLTFRIITPDGHNAL